MQTLDTAPVLPLPAELEAIVVDRGEADETGVLVDGSWQHVSDGATFPDPSPIDGPGRELGEAMAGHPRSV